MSGKIKNNRSKIKNNRRKEKKMSFKKTKFKVIKVARACRVANFSYRL